MLQNRAFWRKRCELDGVTFLLDFKWSGRASAWTVSVFTADEEPIVQGLTLVSNRPLFRRFKWDSRMPRGELYAFDATATIGRAGYDQLGPIVSVLYFEAADL